VAEGSDVVEYSSIEEFPRCTTFCQARYSFLLIQHITLSGAYEIRVTCVGLSKELWVLTGLAFFFCKYTHLLPVYEQTDLKK
jgi:hypothetical protein